MVDSQGLIGTNEEPLAAAKREFFEEVGIAVEGAFENLGNFRQPWGKTISTWTVETEVNPAKLKSNEFEIE